MNRISFAALLALLTLACAEPSEPVTAREPVAMRFVSAEELEIRESANPSAPILATFARGESVSVLAEQGEWAEIRIAFDRSGWALRQSLSATPPEKETVDGTSTPRFRVPPSPVFTPGSIRGEVVLEATVNTNGEVIDVKTIRNTTGRADLEAKNMLELRRASFYPMVVDGRRRTFIYEHRVTY
ncbi:MAG TPA: SH3 domain-containing protein [Thermoanaerobaculia bacterium]|nr:SH3 domain-containing protein [Thermoanaerobaculia bacterium]